MSRRCCCDYGCEIGQDDFDDREDGPVPEDDPKWIVLAGDWEFDDGTVTGDGILATRFCHPAVYELGSIYAEFRLKGIEVGVTHKVRFGHPEDAPHEIWIEHAAGNTRIITLKTGGDKEVIFEVPDLLLGEEPKVAVAFAPGLYLAMTFPDVVVPHWLNGSICATDDDTADCHIIEVAGEDENVGNFAFLEGTFDDFDYEVHWLENRDCKSIACFCYKKYGTEEELKCLPPLLHLTITNIFATPTSRTCFPMAGTYEMEQEKQEPSHMHEDSGWIMKRDWLSEEIEIRVGGTWIATLFYRLTCRLDKETGELSWGLVVFNPFSVKLLWFDADTETYDPVEDEPGYEPDRTDSVDNFLGTCDPFYLRFPDGVPMESETQEPSLICLNEGWELGDPYPRVKIEVTI